MVEKCAGSFFLLMEECLMDGLVQNGKLVIDNMEYDKIVITPLVMDFGTKTTYYDKAHYNNKPVKNQL